MQFGTAWQDITPDRPIPICGQMRERLGEYTHDPLTVNAVAMKSGQTLVVLVSCDLAMLPESIVRDIQAACAATLGIPAASVIVGCTHTHLAPFTVDFLFGKADPEFITKLREAIVRAAARSLDDLEEVQVFAGSGWLDQMGFNRRGMHGDGKADMYYGSWNPDFTGVEGPRDGQVSVLFARRGDGSVKVVIPSFSTHPNSVEGECFYSADLVGSVRNVLRRNLGGRLGVVYLTGAAGNTAPSQLENNPTARFPWRDEEGWVRSGLYLGSEILKSIAGATEPMVDPVLRLEQRSVPIPIRTWPSAFRPADLTHPGTRSYYEEALAAWPKMLQEESPVQVRLNVLRIGDAAICTNPAELFVEHGLAIKKQSPARVTLIFQLTDGYVGYVPTQAAFKRGGYETWPAPSSKLAENAGDVMAEHAGQMLRTVFA